VIACKPCVIACKPVIHARSAGFPAGRSAGILPARSREEPAVWKTAERPARMPALQTKISDAVTAIVVRLQAAISHLHLY
jgi:hypothetical protein